MPQMSWNGELLLAVMVGLLIGVMFRYCSG